MTRTVAILFACLCLGSAPAAWGASALSVGGLGEPSLEESARLRALGGAGAAEHGPRNFSLVNPASVGEVEHLVLEGTILPESRRVESLSSGSETAHDTAIPSLRALIRLPGKFTVGAAYLVGTNARFGIDRPETSGTTSTLRIDGVGGIDLIRITMARRLNSMLNVGADYEVIAGSFREDWVRDFADTALATTRDTLEASWEHQGRWRLGAQLHRGGWALGGVYEMARRLPLTTTQRTAGSFVRREHQSLLIPSGFTVGAAGSVTERLKIAAQYRRANWDKEAVQSDLVDFRALERYGFGIEWLPPPGETSFLKRLPVRVGGSILKWPDLLPPAGAGDVSGGSVGVKEWTVSLGTGIRSQDRGGSVDFTLEAGSRGDRDALGLREKFLRLAVTLQVSDDTWK
ncbi:MAG TPA: hypothetical protein VK123_08865 [Candidatus Limnocylindrales bacterium]|nr:hypothetical protein [Candidatus Limnocylindrales bacterium]